MLLKLIKATNSRKKLQHFLTNQSNLVQCFAFIPCLPLVVGLTFSRIGVFDKDLNTPLKASPLKILFRLPDNVTLPNTQLLSPFTRTPHKNLTAQTKTKNKARTHTREIGKTSSKVKR